LEEIDAQTQGISGNNRPNIAVLYLRTEVSISSILGEGT